MCTYDFTLRVSGIVVMYQPWSSTMVRRMEVTHKNISKTLDLMSWTNQKRTTAKVEKLIEICFLHFYNIHKQLYSIVIVKQYNEYSQT